MFFVSYYSSVDNIFTYNSLIIAWNLKGKHLSPELSWMLFLLPEMFFLLSPLDPESINPCPVSSIIFSVLPLLKPLLLISYHNAYILYSEWKRKVWQGLHCFFHTDCDLRCDDKCSLNQMGSIHDKLTPEVGIGQLLVFFQCLST